MLLYPNAVAVDNMSPAPDTWGKPVEKPRKTGAGALGSEALGRATGHAALQ